MHRMNSLTLGEESHEKPAEPTASAAGLERVVQKLVAPPFLPAHEQVATGKPKVVQVRMVIEEKLIDVDQSGTKIWAMTYNGSVPGPVTCRRCEQVHADSGPPQRCRWPAPAIVHIVPARSLWKSSRSFVEVPGLWAWSVDAKTP